MKRYINQLTYAKCQCENRLRLLGWMGYPVEEAVEASTMITRKVISELCKIAKNVCMYIPDQVFSTDVLRRKVQPLENPGMLFLS